MVRGKPCNFENDQSYLSSTCDAIHLHSMVITTPYYTSYAISAKEKFIKKNQMNSTSSTGTAVVGKLPIYETKPIYLTILLIDCHQIQEQHGAAFSGGGQAWQRDDSSTWRRHLQQEARNG